MKNRLPNHRAPDAASVGPDLIEPIDLSTNSEITAPGRDMALPGTYSDAPLRELAGTGAANPPRKAARQKAPSANWILPTPHPDAESLAREANLPVTVAQLLYSRGITTAEAIEKFLAPAIDQLHSPYELLGMTAAVVRIQTAIANKESILIYGDYDVDGTTAVVLLKTAIEILGGTVSFHVPHRIREGYGMQVPILTTAFNTGIRLVISVDTGIRAFAAAAEAARLNLDLIVTDHHLPDESLGIPDALAVLNPNQPGCAYPNKHLCGAGVAFKLAEALLTAHDPERTRTKLLPSFLKLLSIATIADAVPLTGENRAITAIGLSELRNPVNPGLRALLALANLDPAARPFTAYDIGFRIAPRINAAGRMDVASDVIELFTTRDPIRARDIAQKLHDLNDDRRATEQSALDEVLAQLDADSTLAEAPALVLDGPNWHRGVIGILASRVVERTHRPTLILTHSSETDPANIEVTASHSPDEAHGSGRSIPGFHLLDAITACHEVDHALFTRFGGHAHAVGFSLPENKIPILRERLTAYAASVLKPADLIPTLAIDAELPLDRITPALLTWLHRFAPFGHGNAEPTFYSTRVRVSAAPRIMKDRHLRLRLTQGPRGAHWNAVGWSLAALSQSLNLDEGSIIDIAYRLRENNFSGTSGFAALELELCSLRASALP